MAGGNRSQRVKVIEWVFPLIGILMAIALSFGIGSIAATTRIVPPSHEQIEQHAAAQTRYTQAVARPPNDADQTYSAYPDADSYKCYYAKQHDSADLCAQWRAAIAAEQSARWAFWGFAVSGIATLLSGLGLVALLRSLRQTEDSLDESRAANSISRAQFEQGYRPILHLEPFGPHILERDLMPLLQTGEPVSFHLRVGVKVTNHGEMATIIAFLLMGFDGERPLGGREHNIDRILKKDSVTYLADSGRISGYRTDQRDEFGDNPWISFLQVPFAQMTLDPADYRLAQPPAFYGQILYVDALGIKRIMGFGFISKDIYGGAFESWGGAAWNYDRKIE